jgi:hypothetical protein
MMDNGRPSEPHPRKQFPYLTSGNAFLDAHLDL